MPSTKCQGKVKDPPLSVVEFVRNLFRNLGPLWLQARDALPEGIIPLIDISIGNSF